ncbi:20317_t:CDS:2 [Funneliformis geosporum]|nr:20317_t:CDS:2 [Funneliformis geosporum]
MSEKLQSTKDLLVRKIFEREVRLLKTNNQYHSPEDSGCCNFLRKYIDKLYEEISKTLQRRSRICDGSYVLNETTALLNASKWSVSRYKRSLKNEVNKTIQIRSSIPPTDE